MPQSPAFAQPAEAGSRDQALDALLTGWFNEDLRENPGFATSLGLDTGALAALRGRLGDDQPGQDRGRPGQGGAPRRASSRRSAAPGSSPAGQLNYDIADFRGQVGTMGARFHYGNAGGRPAPYVVSQLGGAYYQVPDFLDTQHPIHNAQDADYYLSRLRAIRRQSRPGNRPHPPRRVARRDPARLRARQGDRQSRAAARHAGGGDQPGPVARAARARGECRRRLRAARRRHGLPGPIAAALDRQIAALQRAAAQRQP